MTAEDPKKADAWEATRVRTFRRAHRARAAWKWGFRLSVAAAGLIVLIAAWSERNALSYREDCNGVANRFLLWNSSITIIAREGPSRVILTGIEMFPPGWSVNSAIVRGFMPRVWVPVVRRNASSIIDTFWEVRLPLWCVPVGLAPLAWYCRRRSMAWREPGVCVACGYDRAGLAADAVCPECGAVVPS